MTSIRETLTKLLSDLFKDKLSGDLLWVSALDPRSEDLMSNTMPPDLQGSGVTNPTCDRVIL
ncbi:Hypothetical protein PHPALM_5998 [Phytophthora palmivora]|uniref:Uncharacterized protein n=1 Tax=Phytophthora palmivora TaxID=4796 RepID=A0A2P4YG25_9STRA|nr:Hypothetical protein PHPALM_5998 [Phytophthora palmivora]